MATIGEDFLAQAIHSEIVARDAYRKLSNRIESEGGKRVMTRMAEEEEGHRVLLSERFHSLNGRPFDESASHDGATDLSFVEKSVFSRTDTLEALKLCLGAEIDAIHRYSFALDSVTEPQDRRMLRLLIRFERGHRKKIERQIGRLTKLNR